MWPRSKELASGEEWKEALVLLGAAESEVLEPELLSAQISLAESSNTEVTKYDSELQTINREGLKNR